ncbi:MAG TPA: S-layer homology domain-containing protein [Candidatus Limnocylindria bacterium]|nr:S-layer homology domain-containing protein [Candidatus Limnocylindria bacterium]
MIRRFGAVLIGLALTLPLSLSAVTAHTTAGVTVDYDVVGDTIVGTVTNHTSTRLAGIDVTATWDETPDPDVTATGPVLVTNLAPHAASPFELAVPDEADGLTLTSVTAAGTVSGTKPIGGLDLAGSLTGDTYNGTIHNESASNGTNIVVYAVRSDGTGFEDAAESAPVTVNAGVSGAAFTINFDAAGDGTTVYLIAKTSAGAFLTSWNNFFGDLGKTAFKSEIEFLADEGITLGCGNANFCPTSNVTREQMALFLVRAQPTVFDDPTPYGFTDIDHLSQASQDAINALANADVSGGCSLEPLKYCPKSSVTRGQMSKFIALAYDLPPATDDYFTDDEGHFSEDFNNQMFEASITSGCGTDKYCPSSTLKREQMAKFLFEAETP